MEGRSIVGTLLSPLRLEPRLFLWVLEVIKWHEPRKFHDSHVAIVCCSMGRLGRLQMLAIEWGIIFILINF